MGGAQARRFDVVLFGATSFVGQITSAYLAERFETDSIRWAIAGRNRSKLESLAAELGLDIPIVVADASNPETIEAMVGDTSLVISTVGPYALHGSAVVEASARLGTDYCDLTGEPQWMQRMIDAHQEPAVASGARLVHACGFDSIPSDLGVRYTQAKAEELLGSPCSQISMRVKALKGGASGGTIASVLRLVEEATHDPVARRILTNPYALAPVGMREGVRQPNILTPMRDEASAQWIAPFVMAAVNVRVVHRTHALLGRSWGGDFLYDEAMLTGSGPQGFAMASAVTAALAGFSGAASVGPLRRLLESKVLPKPGEGPTPSQQERGFFDLRFYGTTPTGKTLTTRVTGDRDPGYGSTAKMLGEAALALHNTDPADLPGGFWTPATAFGLGIIPLLESHAGLSFSIVD